MELKSLGLKTIYLDLNNDIIGSFFAKEGEFNSRGLLINVLSNGKVADTTGIDIFMYALTADSKVYERKATIIDSSNGKYELIYPANMLVTGKTKVELRLKKGKDNISTKTFILDVDKAIVSDNLIEGVDEPSLIEKLLEAGRNEEERVQAENTREQNEKTRESNESTRESNETKRLDDEDVRSSNEDTRESNESTRESSEEERIINEDKRKTNEITREDNESTREQNETARKSNESTRGSSEEERIINEDKRKTNETERINKESLRVSQETERNQHEDTRESNESTREANEDNRKKEEIDRVNLYNQVKNDYETGRFKGDKGEPFVYEDFTPEQLEGLRGPKGETGNIENLTSNHVTTALGYTPLNEDSLPDNLETTQGSQAKADEAETNAKEYADTELAKKVDKVTGKGLSTNDYTTAEKNKLKDIQAGAQVNTVTSVAGRTGAVVVSKSDVGLDNVDNLSAASIRSGTTKADIGLSNVTNDKQMPISGGILENYGEKLSTVGSANGSINLSLGNVFQHSPSGNITYSITNAVNGQAHSFTLIINMGSTLRTLTFPASVKWQGGEIPDMSTANKTYVLTFMTTDAGSTWLGMYGGAF